MKKSIKLRLVGAVVLFFNLWLIGRYNLQGITVIFLTFGFAIGYEYFIVRPALKVVNIKNNSEERYNAQFINDESFKKCPYCAELIKVDAIKCRFCKEMIDSEVFDSKREESDTENSESLNEISNIMNPMSEIQTKSEPEIIKGVLCIDNCCTGFTDKDGYCDKCGKDSSGRFKNNKISIGNLSFCSEDNCIGKIGNDGKCAKCGK